MIDFALDMISSCCLFILKTTKGYLKLLSDEVISTFCFLSQLNLSCLARFQRTHVKVSWIPNFKSIITCLLTTNANVMPHCVCVIIDWSQPWALMYFFPRCIWYVLKSDKHFEWKVCYQFEWDILWMACHLYFTYNLYVHSTHCLCSTCPFVSPGIEVQGESENPLSQRFSQPD